MRSTKLWLMWLVLGASIVRAQAPDMTPADMRPGLNPWNGTIPFPKGEADVNVLIVCQGMISPTGVIETASCFTDDPANGTYIRALKRVVDAARADPAVVDGARTRVFTVFSVLFLRQQGVETIALFQNDMADRERYGVAYVAPQIHYPGPPTCRCSTNRRFIRRFVVAADGTATVEFPPGLERCQMCWNNRVARMKFIPGQVDGEFAETTMNMFVDPN